MKPGWTWMKMICKWESGDSSVFMMILTYILHLPPTLNEAFRGIRYPSNPGGDFHPGLGGRSTLYLLSKSISGDITNWSMTATVVETSWFLWFGEAPDLFERALLKFQALEWRVLVLMLCWICVGLGWYGCVGVVVLVWLYWLEWIRVVVLDLCWICRKSARRPKRVWLQIDGNVRRLKSRCCNCWWKTSAEPPEMHETLWKQRDILDINGLTRFLP